MKEGLLLDRICGDGIQVAIDKGIEPPIDIEPGLAKTPFTRFDEATTLTGEASCGIASQPLVKPSLPYAGTVETKGQGRIRSGRT